MLRVSFTLSEATLEVDVWWAQGGSGTVWEPDRRNWVLGSCTLHFRSMVVGAKRPQLLSSSSLQELVSSPPNPTA